jgi:hypothetical protein
MVKRTTHARHQFGCHLKLLLGLTLDYRRSNAWGLTRRGAFSVYPFPHTSRDATHPSSYGGGHERRSTHGASECQLFFP